MKGFEEADFPPALRPGPSLGAGAQQGDSGRLLPGPATRPVTARVTG